MSTDPVKGILYVVATPIGNLNDISERAIQTLNRVSLIACEDTRHTRKLCHHHDISTPLKACHQHNEQSASQQLLETLLNGQDVALVSDAGTPAISDPGHVLVNLAHRHEVQVVPVPGPSAVTALMSATGFAPGGFYFHGFLPVKSQQRLQTLQALQTVPGTLVFYEAPHRIVDALQDMHTVFGEQRRCCLGKELSKAHERILNGTIANVRQQLIDGNWVKGEFVVALEAPTKSKPASLDSQALALIEALSAHVPPSTLSRVLAQHLNLDRKAVYRHLSGLKNT